jgi:hypothetical protein
VHVFSKVRSKPSNILPILKHAQRGRINVTCGANPIPGGGGGNFPASYSSKKGYDVWRFKRSWSRDFWLILVELKANVVKARFNSSTCFLLV